MPERVCAHAKAGRWSAAQAWYELQLAENPGDEGLEERVLSCFRETGRYEPLLRYADSFMSLRNRNTNREAVASRLLPSVLEAQWMIGDLEGLKTFVTVN